MTDKRRIYTREFKDSVIQMVLDTGKSAAAVARELGLPEWQVGSWVRAARKAATTNGGIKNSDAEQELKKLQREHKRLKEENEILKKAAAFFAQHQQ